MTQGSRIQRDLSEGPPDLGVPSMVDFQDMAFDPEEWAAEFVAPEDFGRALVQLLDRPVVTTVVEGKSQTVVTFEGQEFEALQALAERLRG